MKNIKKHCQRHNGPEGWVHLAKVTSWSHIRSSNINLDHISSLESRLSINPKSQPNIGISTKLKIQNLDQRTTIHCTALSRDELENTLREAIQGAYFPIHLSSRQCNITILSWGNRCIVKYVSSGSVLLTVSDLISLLLWKRNVFLTHKHTDSGHPKLTPNHSDSTTGWILPLYLSIVQTEIL